MMACVDRMVANCQQSRPHLWGFRRTLAYCWHKPQSSVSKDGTQLFHLVATISVFVGILNWIFAWILTFRRAMLTHAKGQWISKQSAWQVIEEMIKESKFAVQIPTFQIFVAEGVSGTFPWLQALLVVFLGVRWVISLLCEIQMLGELFCRRSVMVHHGRIFISWNGPATNFYVISSHTGQFSRRLCRRNQQRASTLSIGDWSRSWRHSHHRHSASCPSTCTTSKKPASPAAPPWRGTGRTRHR